MAQEIFDDTREHSDEEEEEENEEGEEGSHESGYARLSEDGDSSETDDGFREGFSGDNDVDSDKEQQSSQFANGGEGQDLGRFQVFEMKVPSPPSVSDGNGNRGEFAGNNHSVTELSDPVRIQSGRAIFGSNGVDNLPSGGAHCVSRSSEIVDACDLGSENEEKIRVERERAEKYALDADVRRRSAPLSENHKATIVSAMKGISFGNFEPNWASVVPEEKWLKMIREKKGDRNSN